jgi:anaerobic ribonucleoside-triphosphate reductase activating protein
LNFIKTKTYDIANGPGVRVTIFVAGCPHEPKCPYCFNPETYDFNGGKPFTEEEMNKLLNEAQKSYITGITLLGGEPMDPRNQKGLLPYVKKFKELCPEKTVWCYTGFSFEDVMKMYETQDVTKELLPLLDILVDGKFINELKDPRLVFRGSSNQRIIDVQETLKTGNIVEWVKPKYI